MGAMTSNVKANRKPVSTTDTHVPQAMTRPRPPLIYIHCTALAVWSLMLPESSPHVVLVAFSLLSLIYLALYNDRRFTHPVAVFTLFFYPYSTWFVYYSLMKGGYREDLLAELLKLEFLGLWAFAVASDAMTSLMSRRTANAAATNSVNHAGRLSVSLPVVASLAVILLSLFDAMSSGASTKSELVGRGSEFATLSGIASVILTAGAILVAISLLRDRGAWATFTHPALLVMLIVMLGSVAILGERDYVFRFGFCMLVVYFSQKRNASLVVMLLILLALTAVLPFSQAAKGLLLPGGEFGKNFSVDDIFLGEFFAASRNIYMLLHYGVEQSYSFLVTDLARGLLPLSGGGDLRSAGNWYNNVYRVQNNFAGNSGWGFSLVAEGYLVGGSLGVVVVMGVVGAFAQTLYGLRTRSDYWFALYVLALPTIVYGIRADLANVLSQTIKIGGAAVILFWIAHIMLIAPKRDVARLRKGAQAE
jgi:oligosaccharide repeat unit polymerase